MLVSKCCKYPKNEKNNTCGMCGKTFEANENRPFYIVLWDVKAEVKQDKSIADYKVIKTLDNSIDLESEILKIDGKHYRKCSLNFKLNTLSVEECEAPQHLERLSCKDEITCPNCGYEQSDSWEASDSGDEVCDGCGSEFFYEREVSVSYSMKITKQNFNAREI